MAIYLEMINLIVPIATIEARYPGGWAGCLRDHEAVLGGRVWYDEHLFRNGAMNGMDIQFLLSDWQRKSFRAFDDEDHPTRWVDLCVVDSFGGLTLPCDWIEIEQRKAWLRGTKPGEVYGPGRLP